MLKVFLTLLLPKQIRDKILQLSAKWHFETFDHLTVQATVCLKYKVHAYFCSIRKLHCEIGPYAHKYLLNIIQQTLPNML